MSSRIHNAATCVQQVIPGTYRLSAALVGLDLFRLQEWRGIIIGSQMPRTIKRQFVSSIDSKIRRQQRLATK